MLAIPAQQTSAPKKQGTYDFVDLIFFTGIAIIFDLFSVIPSLGDIGIIAFRFAFWLKKVDTKFMNLTMAGGGIVEIIPAISALPAVTAFVIIVFIETKLMERVKKVSPKAAAALETAAGAAGGDAGSVKAVAGGAGAGAKTGGAGGVATGAGATSTESAVSAGKGAEKTGGQSAGARRTLQDGSEPAKGSPIAGGEDGVESSEQQPGETSQQAPPDQVAKEKKKQEDKETSATPINSEAAELGTEAKDEGKGGIRPEEDPLYNKPLIENDENPRRERRVETSRRPKKSLQQPKDLVV